MIKQAAGAHCAPIPASVHTLYPSRRSHTPVYTPAPLPALIPHSRTRSVQPKLEMQQGKAGLEKFLISEELWRKGLMW